MIKRHFALIGILCLCACVENSDFSAPGPPFTHYETSGETDALYIIDGEFAFHRSMQPSEGLESFLREIAVPIPKDKFGCLRLEPLVLPNDIADPQCEDVSFVVRTEGAGIVLYSSCDVRGQLCQLQRYNAEGQLTQFQFSPDEPLSDPYSHVSGAMLVAGG